MRDAVRYLVENSRCFVSVIPNAGLPLDGAARRDDLPEDAARDGARAARVRASTSASTRSADAAARRPSTSRPSAAVVDELERSGVRGRDPEPKPLQFVASAMTAVPLEQERQPAADRRAHQRAGLAQDQAAAARRKLRRDRAGRARAGRGRARTCSTSAPRLTERTDEAVQMATRRQTPRPVDRSAAGHRLDRTRGHRSGAEDLRRAAPVVNSINLENGRTQARRRDAARPRSGRGRHRAHDRRSRDGEDRRSASSRSRGGSHDIVTGEYELPPGALIFDALTFTLATGDPEFLTSAVETIEGIRLIKRELPGVLTSLGVSNVSFGLKPAARAALNSVMLHHCVEAGLDMAIVNAPRDHALRRARRDASASCATTWCFNRRPDALQRVIEHLGSRRPARAPARRAWTRTRTRRSRCGSTTRSCAGARTGSKRRSTRRWRARDPVDVLNNVLLPAMKEVGDKFGAGELILPFVLQSAEVMKKAVAHLEQFLERNEGVEQGQGRAGDGLRRRARHRQEPRQHDPHQQRLHGVRPRQAGPDEHDPRQGRRGQRRRDRPLGAARLDVQADADLRAGAGRRADLSFPIVVGGAAINRDFGRRIAFVDERAAVRARACSTRRTPSRDSRSWIASPRPTRRRAKRSVERIARRSACDARARPRRARRRCRATGRRRREPFASPTSRRRRSSVRASSTTSTCATLWPCFDLKSLYRLSWGGANVKGEAWERLVRDEFAPRLAAYQRRAEARRDLVVPRAVYGYFPAAGLGDDVIVYDPTIRRREIARFPLHPPGRRRAPVLGRLPARTATTAAPADVDRAAGRDRRPRRLARDRRRCRRGGDYSESYFLHGFSVQAAEALAEAHAPARARGARPRRRAGGSATGGATAPVRTSRSTRRLAAARRRARDRRRADRGVSDRPRAVDRGDRRSTTRRPRTSTRRRCAS